MGAEGNGGSGLVDRASGRMGWVLGVLARVLASINLSLAGSAAVGGGAAFWGSGASGVGRAERPSCWAVDAGAGYDDGGLGGREPGAVAEAAGVSVEAVVGGPAAAAEPACGVPVCDGDFNAVRICGDATREGFGLATIEGC